jgi:hypothetical protein
MLVSFVVGDRFARTSGRADCARRSLGREADGRWVAGSSGARLHSCFSNACAVRILRESDCDARASLRTSEHVAKMNHALAAAPAARALAANAVLAQPSVQARAAYPQRRGRRVDPAAVCVEHREDVRPLYVGELE